MRRSMFVLMMMLALLLTAAPASAQDGVGAATRWLQGQVQPDGGIGDGFSDGSSLSATIDAVFAAAAAGEDISTWGDGNSPLAYIVRNADGSESTGLTAKLVMVAQSTGTDPMSFTSHNPLQTLESAYDETSGLFEGNLIDHALAMLAWRAAGKDVPDAAAAALISFQGEDGGWAFDGVSASDTNTTGVALQALVAAGRQDDPAVDAALDYLKTQQNPDGGVPYQNPSDFGTESDANSTAWLIQALLALDEDLADWNHPERFLASLQGESGALQWKAEVPGENILATIQAIPALAGVTFLDLPVVTASIMPAGEESSASEPASLPTTGQASPPLWPLLLGMLALAAGGALRRAVA